MTSNAISCISRATLRTHERKSHLGEVIDASVSADDGIALPLVLQIFAGVNTMNEQAEIDSLRRLRSFSRVGRIGPLRSISVGGVMAEDAHLDVVAITPMQG